MSDELPSGAAKDKKLSKAALDALREAEERRAREAPAELPPEKGGTKGPEPTRFGDWEKGGKISDF